MELNNIVNGLVPIADDRIEVESLNKITRELAVMPRNSKFQISGLSYNKTLILSSYKSIQAIRRAYVDDQSDGDAMEDKEDSRRLNLQPDSVLRNLFTPSSIEFKRSDILENRFIFGVYGLPYEENETPFSIWVIKHKKYTIQTIMSSDKIFQFVISISRTHKIVLKQKIQPEFGLIELFYIGVIKDRTDKADFVIFRVIQKEYMYEFSQIYTFLIIDLKRRKTYFSDYQEEGSFENIRDLLPLIHENRMYLWDQKNGIDVFELSKKQKKIDFGLVDKIVFGSPSKF